MFRIFGLSLFFLLITFGSLNLNAQNTDLKLKEVNSLQEVRKIYVDKWGSDVRDSEFAESSCKIYQDDQRRSNCRMSRMEITTQRNIFYNTLPYLFEDFGFQIVSKFEEADAVMSMRVSVQKNCGGLVLSSFWKGRPAGIYVETIEAHLKTFGGKDLWSASSPGKNSFRDGTLWIAEKLRNSKYKLAKPKKTD